ncbi:MAG: ATPase [Deltaproteobacteria bacterium]|nr:MAG: ATPase [Deltaproteobacteria bacterium]
MPVDVQTETVIACPRDRVAAYACDPDNAPAWYANIDTVEWRTEPPLALGSRVAFVARFLGRRLAYTYEIVEYEPGRRLVMRTAEGPFPMETTYVFEDAPGGTRMQLRNRGEPAGFSKLVAPMMAAAMRRANETDLAAIKQILEGGQGSG